MDAPSAETIAAAAESLALSAAEWPIIEGVLALLAERGDWQRLQRAYRKALLVVSTSPEPSIGGIPRATRERALWRELARVYRDRLQDEASALEAFGLLVRLGGDEAVSDSLELAAIHQRSRRYDEALSIVEALLATAPAERAIYERLFEIHSLRCEPPRETPRETDAAWCAAAALVLLGEPREAIRAFYDAHAPRLLPPRARALDDAHWATLRDPDEERFLSDIFRLVAPLAPAAEENHAIDDDVLAWALDALGAPPANTALRAGTKLEELRGSHALPWHLFLAARAAACRRFPEYALAELETGPLKVLVLAAMHAALPGSPVPDDLAKWVREYAGKIASDLPPDTLPALKRACTALMDAGGKIDVVRWRRAVRRTWLRAGILLCGDPCAAAPLFAGADTDLTPEAKLAAAAAFTASKVHGDLRMVLGWTGEASARAPNMAAGPRRATIEELVDRPPRTVGELFATLDRRVDDAAVQAVDGRSLVLPGLRVTLTDDGVPPDTDAILRKKLLHEWKVTFAIGLGSVEEVLAERFGAPMRLRDTRRYGPFSVFPDGGDAGSLVYYGFACAPVVPLIAIAASPDGSLVAVGDAAGRLRVWSRSAMRVTGFFLIGFPFRRLAWTHDGGRLVAFFDRRHAIELFAADGTKHIETIEGTQGGAAPSPLLFEGDVVDAKPFASASSACCVPGTPLALSTHADGRIRIWKRGAVMTKLGELAFVDHVVPVIAEPEGADAAAFWAAATRAGGKRCAACGATVDPLIRFPSDEELGEQCPACGHVAPDLALAYPSIGAAKLVRDALLALPGRSPKALRCLAIANLFTDADLPQEELWSRRAARFDDAEGHTEAARAAERRADSCKRGTPAAPLASPLASAAAVVAPPVAPVAAIARTVTEMRFFASLEPCAACGATAPDAKLELFGARTKWSLVGRCPHCNASRSLPFVTEGDPNAAPCPPGELGDARPSAIVSPAALLAELLRIMPIAKDDDALRARGVLCIRELMKVSPEVLAHLTTPQGERVTNGWLLYEHNMLHAAALAAHAAPLERVLRVVLDEAGPPPTVGALEQALGFHLTDAHVATNAHGRLSFAASPLLSLGADVRSVSMEYPVRRPIKTLQDLRARPLACWSIGFRRGHDAIQSAVAARAGWTVTPVPPEGACTLAFSEPART